MPAYEQILHCSHVFNLLDARGVLGRDERMATILRIRKLSERLAKAFLKQRYELGFPMLAEEKRPEAKRLYEERYLQTRK
jgi:glycyl-tRNA synthetase alpha chain